MPTYTGYGGRPYMSEKEAALSPYSESTQLTWKDPDTGLDYPSQKAMEEAKWKRTHPGQS